MAVPLQYRQGLDTVLVFAMHLSPVAIQIRDLSNHNHSQHLVVERLVIGDMHYNTVAGRCSFGRALYHFTVFRTNTLHTDLFLNVCANE